MQKENDYAETDGLSELTQEEMLDIRGGITIDERVRTALAGLDLRFFQSGQFVI